MRKHLVAASAAAAAVAALVLPVTAQASAPRATSAQSADPATAAGWVYHSGPYDSRFVCDVRADDFYNREGIRGQCRGPYDYGKYKVFYLYLWK
ncbi:hypothetical protein ACWGBH_04130 [Streptomyces massasporeus]